MIKRIFDLIFSLAIFFLLFPIILVVGLLVFANFGWPIFFSQIRPGYLGKPFRIYKFRTMSNRVDVNGTLLSDFDRLTKFGFLLRSTSLDELPALWNVLIGDMSLVGPRPLLMEYLPLYSKEQSRRHNVKPGITGWAQVNGRNAILWAEKFNFDVWYVDNQSFMLDMKILIMTFKKVLIRDGITEDGKVTVSKFEGDTQ